MSWLKVAQWILSPLEAVTAQLPAQQVSISNVLGGHFRISQFAFPWLIQIYLPGVFVCKSRLGANPSPRLYALFETDLRCLGPVARP